MQRVSEENESPLIMECQACAHREYAEILISPRGFIEDGRVEYMRVIVRREGKKAKAEEVRALRNLNPELGSLPMSEAAKRIGSSQSIDFGVHRREDAQDLLKRAEAWGLKVILEPPEENSSDREDRRRFFEPFRAPVSVGAPGEDTNVIPFGWVVIGVALILAVLVWVLFLELE